MPGTVGEDLENDNIFCRKCGLHSSLVLSILCIRWPPGSGEMQLIRVSHPHSLLRTSATLPYLSPEARIDSICSLWFQSLPCVYSVISDGSGSSDTTGGRSLNFLFPPQFYTSNTLHSYLLCQIYFVESINVFCRIWLLDFTY